MTNPSDVSAERGVLSGITRYGKDVYIDLADIITDETFTLDSNKIIFRCLKHLIEHGISQFDIASILSASKSLGYYDHITSKNEREHLKAILNTIVEKDNIRKLASKVKKLEIVRGGIDTLNTTQKKLYNVTGDETLPQIISSIETPVFDYVLSLGESKDGPQKLGASAMEFVEYVANNVRDSVGIPTGFKVYDYVIGGGLRPGISVIAARAKKGKTSLNLNAAFYIASILGIPVLIIDTELKTYEYHGRALANLSDFSIYDIETGQFTRKNGLDKVKECAKVYEDMPIYHESVIGKPFDETLSIIRRWFLKTVGTDANGKIKPCVVIYDFLRSDDRQEINSNMAEHQSLGFKMMDLTQLVKTYDVPCLLFIQANRDGISKEHSGIASGSDRILWFCNNFSLFKPKSIEEIANDGINAGNRKLMVLDARHGPGLNEGEYINMQFNGSRCRIKELGLGHVADENKSNDTEPELPDF